MRQEALAAELRQKDVLKHRQIGGEAGLLHDDGDAGVERLAGGAVVERLALVEDLAGIARHMPGDNLRQRGFSGAVGAEEAVDLAGTELQAGARQRPRAVEGLVDVPRDEDGRSVRHGALRSAYGMREEAARRGRTAAR